MKTNSKYFYCLQQSSSLSEQINSCILKIIHLTFQHQIMCTSIEDAKLQLMNICRYKRVLAVKLQVTFTVIQDSIRCKLIVGKFIYTKQLNANSAIFQLYHGKIKLIFHVMMMSALY